jgi:mRNA deadenylase 3'-5' endonuclease subunit Ccr4
MSHPIPLVEQQQIQQQEQNQEQMPQFHYNISKYDNYSICTYNVLAQALVSREYFPWTQPAALKWSFRQKLFETQIPQLNCDIYCFQEMDINHYKSFWSVFLNDLGYATYFSHKAGQFAKHGLCIAYKKSLFLSITQHTIQFDPLHMVARDCVEKDEISQANLGQIVVLLPFHKLHSNLTNTSHENQQLQQNTKSREIPLLFILNNHLHWRYYLNYTKMRQLFLLRFGTIILQSHVPQSITINNQQVLDQLIENAEEHLFNEKLEKERKQAEEEAKKAKLKEFHLEQLRIKAQQKNQPKQQPKQQPIVEKQPPPVQQPQQQQAQEQQTAQTVQIVQTSDKVDQSDNSVPSQQKQKQRVAPTLTAEQKLINEQKQKDRQLAREMKEKLAKEEEEKNLKKIIVPTFLEQLVSLQPITLHYKPTLKTFPFHTELNAISSLQPHFLSTSTLPFKQHVLSLGDFNLTTSTTCLAFHQTHYWPTVLPVYPTQGKLKQMTLSFEIDKKITPIIDDNNNMDAGDNNTNNNNNHLGVTNNNVTYNDKNEIIEMKVLGACSEMYIKEDFLKFKVTIS